MAVLRYKSRTLNCDSHKRDVLYDANYSYRDVCNVIFNALFTFVLFTLLLYSCHTTCPCYIVY